MITENDIKNLIMSKASIHAACVTLMKEAGVTRTEIATIYFAGAFGNYINKKNATIIGLIPEIDIDRIKNIGNGAVAGANIALINRRKRKRSTRLRARSPISNSMRNRHSWTNIHQARSSRTPISPSSPWSRRSSNPPGEKEVH